MQTVKLSNYDVIGMNEFEFQSLTLYNFKISEETFSQLTKSELSVQIDEMSAKGTLMMGKFLLSPNFQLKATI
jgi:aminopeptidase-like protein